MSTYTCANPRCGKSFQARPADRARGWARFCGKSCKAVEQEARTGQYRNLIMFASPRIFDDPEGWDGHKDI